MELSENDEPVITHRDHSVVLTTGTRRKGSHVEDDDDLERKQEEFNIDELIPHEHGGEG